GILAEFAEWAKDRRILRQASAGNVRRLTLPICGCRDRNAVETCCHNYRRTAFPGNQRELRNPNLATPCDDRRPPAQGWRLRLRLTLHRRPRIGRGICHRLGCLGVELVAARNRLSFDASALPCALSGRGRPD